MSEECSPVNVSRFRYPDKSGLFRNHSFSKLTYIASLTVSAVSSVFEHTQSKYVEKSTISAGNWWPKAPIAISRGEH